MLALEVVLPAERQGHWRGAATLCSSPVPSAGWGRTGDRAQADLWQSPEVLNLLRHLKNINKNLSWKGTAYLMGPWHGREGEPKGKSKRRLWALLGEATTMLLASAGREGTLQPEWV